MSTPAPSASTKTGIYLTQFPASALTGIDGLPLDWTDHVEAHRAVSRLFPVRLPGPAAERRAAAGILYRLDALATDAEPTVLVQSLVLPELTPPLSRTTEVSRRSWGVATGVPVAFRLAVNPVRRTTRYYLDENRSTPAPDPHLTRTADGRRDRSRTKQTARVVPIDELQDWLDSKIGAALSEIEIIGHYRDTTESGSRAGRYKIVVDTIDALARVADPVVLDRLRIEGVGREKAYGCGLLTLTQLG